MSKTRKDTSRERPLWLHKHAPKPPLREGKGGRKTLEQLIRDTEGVEEE